MNHFIKKDQIGCGEFAKVTKVISKKDGLSYAIKEFSKGKDQSKIEKEIKIHSIMNHQNIIKLHSIINEDDNLQCGKKMMMILELADGGELFDYVEKKGTLPSNEIRCLMRELFSALSYLHNKCNISHRDIKLENILLTQEGHLKLTDFGFASVNDVPCVTACGSPCYAAPELVLNTKNYCSKTADLWSCGVVMFAMSFGYLPFEWDVIEESDVNDVNGVNGGNDEENIMNCSKENNQNHHHHWSPSNIYKLYKYINALPQITLPIKANSSLSANGRDLLIRLLQPNPTKRIMLNDVLKHDFFFE